MSQKKSIRNIFQTEYKESQSMDVYIKPYVEIFCLLSMIASTRVCQRKITLLMRLNGVLICVLCITINLRRNKKDGEEC